MIAIVTALLPLLLNLISFLFEKYSASNQAKEMIAELIRLSKNDGLISVKNSDAQLTHHEAVLKQIQLEREAQANQANHD